jgi:hypothetical protein
VKEVTQLRNLTKDSLNLAQTRDSRESLIILNKPRVVMDTLALHTNSTLLSDSILRTLVKDNNITSSSQMVVK